MLSNAGRDLLAFERALLSSVFKGRTEVRVGASGASSSLSRVRRALGRHGVSRGWFTAPPQMFRGGYLGVCVVLVFVGAGGALIGGVQAVEPGADSPVTLIYPMLGVGLALLLPGIVVGVWGWSHRVITPKGEAALANVTAFRTFITSATPPPRDEEPASGGAGDGALDRYLPYAIAFGVTEPMGRPHGRPRRGNCGMVPRFRRRLRGGHRQLHDDNLGRRHRQRRGRWVQRWWRCGRRRRGRWRGWLVSSCALAAAR